MSSVNREMTANDALKIYLISLLYLVKEFYETRTYEKLKLILNFRALKF
jgi:hypothetical protein